MKYSYILVLLIGISCSNKKRPTVKFAYNNVSPVDSIKGYSHFTNGFIVKDGLPYGINQGSGFFYNRNGRLLFVTARHVVSGCHDYGLTPHIVPPEMNVFIYKDGHFTDKIAYFQTGIFYDSSLCDTKNKVDVAVCDVYYKDSFSVNSIENKIVDFLPSDIDAINIFGFPSVENYREWGYQVRNSVYLPIDSFYMDEDFSYIDIDENEKIDTMNYRIMVKNIKIDSTLKGYSGSPVFGRRNEKWVFIGLLSSVEYLNNYLFIVKGKHVLSEILRH